MSVSGLLNIPIVFLMDVTNQQMVRNAIYKLAKLHFTGKIFVFTHYLSRNHETQINDKSLSISWTNVGAEMVYETLCAGRNKSPLEVTYLLLPELLQEKEALVLWTDVGVSMLEQIAKQVDLWKKNHVSLVEQKDFCYLNLEKISQTKSFNALLEKCLEESYNG